MVLRGGTHDARYCKACWESFVADDSNDGNADLDKELAAGADDYIELEEEDEDDGTEAAAPSRAIPEDGSNSSSRSSSTSSSGAGAHRTGPTVSVTEEFKRPAAVPVNTDSRRSDADSASPVDSGITDPRRGAVLVEYAAPHPTINSHVRLRTHSRQS